MSTGTCNGTWAGELGGGWTGMVTISDDLYWSSLDSRLSVLESQIQAIQTDAAETRGTVQNQTYGVQASYSVLNDTVRVDVGAVRSTTSTTAADVTLIRNTVNSLQNDMIAIKRDLADIKTWVTSYRDDWASYKNTYNANDIVYKDKFDDLDEECTRAITQIGGVQQTCNSILSVAEGNSRHLNTIQGVVNNTSDKVDNANGKLDALSQKVDDKATAIQRAFSGIAFAVAKCVRALLEPFYALIDGGNSYGGDVSVQTTDTGVSVTVDRQITDIVDFQGTANGFTIKTAEVEGYGPFDAELGDVRYNYSDELKQVLAMPYRR